MLYKFRPQQLNGKYRLQHNPVGDLHYYPHRWYDSHVLRVGGYLHYLADHAPLPVQSKWKRAFRRFIKLHRKF